MSTGNWQASRLEKFIFATFHAVNFDISLSEVLIPVATPSVRRLRSHRQAHNWALLQQNMHLTTHSCRGLMSHIGIIWMTLLEIITNHIFTYLQNIFTFLSLFSQYQCQEENGRSNHLFTISRGFRGSVGWHTSAEPRPSSHLYQSSRRQLKSIPYWFLPKP